MTETALVEEVGLHPVLARIAAARGLDTDSASLFFSPLQYPLGDPYLLPGMNRAVETIGESLDRGDPILVYGDYDVDGITATAVMFSALSELGADVRPHLPHRMEEGYGLQAEALEALHREGIQLVVTVDTGISAVEEIEVARELGMSVVVTDHHQPPERLPGANAVVNPHLPGSGYPFPHLAGVAVALKLAQALLGDGGEEFLESHADLAALGTVADVLPLVGENRRLVAQGLERMNSRPRPGLEALWETAGREGPIKSWDLAFVLGPRLNAAGRMDHARPALDLLLTRDRGEARRLAGMLEEENSARRQTESRVLDMVERDIRENGREQDPFLLLWGDEWHRGVTGIVASRLVDAYCRPAVVLTREDGVLRGSGRSPDPFDLYGALKECSGLLLSFGGHRAAAGLEVRPEEIDSLREKLCSLARERMPEDWRPPLVIDAWSDLAELDLNLALELDKLEPTGVGNHRPVLGFSGQLDKVRRVGKDRDHLVFRVREGSLDIRCIGFRLGHLADDIVSGESYLVVGRPGVNTWRGRQELEFRVLDMMVEPSEARDTLARLYLAVREAAAEKGQDLLNPEDADLCRALRKRQLDPDPRLIREGLTVFAQLGLLVTMERGGEPCWLVKPPPDRKVSLYHSPAYLDSISGS